MMFDVLQIEWVGGSGRDFQFVVALFPEVCSLARAFLISIDARGSTWLGICGQLLGVARGISGIRQLQHPTRIVSLSRSTIFN